MADIVMAIIERITGIQNWIHLFLDSIAASCLFLP